MRTVFAGLAALFFVINAMSFIPLGAAVIENPGQLGGLDGDPGALAVTWAARTLFWGLALLSAALIEWGRIGSEIARTFGRTRPGSASGE
jgi:hypothetical protein